MKRLISIFAILAVLMTIFAPSAFALPNSAKEVNAPYISAKYVMLVDINSGECLYKKQNDVKMYPASTTKIMTAILVLENCKDLNKVITVDETVLTTPAGSSALYIEVGYKITIENLLYGLMLPSGNDCAIVLAQVVAGSQKAFADMMNAKAKELGMNNTHFTNPHGFHDDNHYTTASDMIKLALYAYKNEMFRNITKISVKNIPFTDKDGNPKTFIGVANTNKLIRSNSGFYYQYCTGMKTGFTDEAGQCLVATATKGDQELLAAIFFDGLSTNTKYQTAKTLFQFGYENYETVNLVELLNAKKLTVKAVNYKKSDDETGIMDLKINLTSPVYYTSTKSVIKELKSSQAEYITITQPDNIETPVKKGSNLGKLVWKYKDEVLIDCDVIAQRDIAKQIVTPDDLVPIPHPPISISLIGDYFKDLGLNVVFVILAVILVIILAVVLYVRARRRISLTRNVYRRGKRY